MSSRRRFSTSGCLGSLLSGLIGLGVFIAVPLVVVYLAATEVRAMDPQSFDTEIASYAEEEVPGEPWRGLVVLGLKATGLYPVDGAAATGSSASYQRGLVRAGEWQLPVISPRLTDGCADHQARGSTCGWDLATSPSSPVFPARAGVVLTTRCGWNDGYGCFVLLDHGEGYQTRYAHLVEGSVTVEVGEEVSADQVIAEVGRTGRTTGPHVHFEIIFQGLPVDPAEVLGSFGEILAKDRLRKRGR